MCIIFRKLKHCRKRWCWWWLFKRYRTCLPCSRNLKLLKTVKLDRLFKKKQRKDLHLRVPLPGCRLHARTDPSLRLDSWFNLPGGKHGMPPLALAVLFRFRRPVALAISMATRSTRPAFQLHEPQGRREPILVTCWPLFGSSKVESFQKRWRRLLLCADLKGWQWCEEFYFSRKLNGLDVERGRLLDAFTIMIMLCSTLFGPVNSYLWQIPKLV